MKKYVIVKTDCTQFANHLWNYLSIYAYGLSTGTPVQNPSFFKWHRFFNLARTDSFMTRVISVLAALGWVWRTAYRLYGSFLIRARSSCVLITLGVITYLPPTKPLLKQMGSCETAYFIGWLFRNPLGLERYRDALIAAFMPKESVLNTIEAAIAPFSGKRLVGVYVRQEPYKGFEDEDFIISPTRVSAIVKEYVREKKLDTEDIAFVIVSDRDIDSATFDDLTVRVSKENEVTNLFLLSRCSVVIGDNSPFSNLAAWFGNVPHLVTTNEPVDWEYYRNPTTYVQNKYATFTH